MATSCNNITPAGFWINFHKDLITNKKSDQGPRGGHLEIYWKNTNTFSTKEIIDFAIENDWELADSTIISADSLNRLTLSKSEIDYSLYILLENVIPMWKKPEIKVYIFRTGWVAIEPGNTRDTDMNGFITINLDRTEMKVYHLWGE